MTKATLTPPDETRARPPRSNPALPLSRRQVLGGLAGMAALGTASGCGPALLRPASPHYPLGVASGEASTSGVLLWTRYTGRAPLTAEVWRAAAGETPPEGEATLRLPAAVSEAGVVRVEVEELLPVGLAPGERYLFRFVDTEGRESPPGRFRTALHPEALERVRVGATSCTRYGHAMDTLARAAGHDAERGGLDAFLWLGDACYTDVSRTPEEYRAKWERTLGEPGLQAVRASAAMLATWDDHEFVNDWAAGSDGLERFGMASEAFFAHMPMRRLPEEPNRLWRSVRWGRTVEFFILDTRGERKPSTRLSDEAEYLSRAQLEWLEAGLKGSECVFKVVLNSVPISEFPGAFFQATVADRWEGYPAQRERLLRYVEEEDIRGVLWVAGDFHLALSGRVSRTGPGSRAREVLVGPGANTPNVSPTYPGPPQVDWASGVNNYAVLDFAPAAGEVTVGWHAADGRVLREETLAL